VVYSDTALRSAITAGQIVCFPLDPNCIKGSSIDVRLGRWYYQTDRISPGSIYNPRDEVAVQRYFRLNEARTHQQVCAELGISPFPNIKPDQLIIVLDPGERILAHTHEFIGIKPPGTTEMRARSSTGRNGIVVCMCAGWGDPGYINRWTMEILNINDCRVVLCVYDRVAQIIFHETPPVGTHYGAGGKYQSGGDLPEIVRSWTPALMLPRAHSDQIVEPSEPTDDDVRQYLAETVSAEFWA
jgi:dCTP deaminase